MAIEPTALRAFHELSHLSHEDLAQMAKQLRLVQYHKGTQICREGDDGDSCYLLAVGAVDVYKDLPDGRRIHLAQLQPHTLIGQTGLVGERLRTAHVIASSDVRLFVLHREPFQWALEQGRPWALSFLQLVSVNLVRQMRTALARLSALANAEDASQAIRGEARTERQAQYINMTDYQSRSSPSLSAAPQPATEPAPPKQEGGNTSPDLLKLLQTTESSAPMDEFDLDSVRFVERDDPKDPNP